MCIKHFERIHRDVLSLYLQSQFLSYQIVIEKFLYAKQYSVALE